jgi:hypothetical protein
MIAHRPWVWLRASCLVGGLMGLGAAPSPKVPAGVLRDRAVGAPPADGGARAPIGRDDRTSLPLTREALWRSFPADIREMVYRWDPRDPRIEQERRRALFDFMYEGFDSAAWVPQSLFERKEMLAPFGDPDAIITRTIGLIGWPQNRSAKTYGMAPDLAPGRPLGWTANCVTCHIAEIDGVVYFGGGGKMLDEMMLKLAVQVLTGARWRDRLLGDPQDDRTAAETHRILRMHRFGPMDPLTRGRSTAFAASHVEMSLRKHGGKFPEPSVVGRADIKPPPLWNTAAKKPFGRWYCDGSFRGEYPLLASSMELALDRSFDHLMVRVIPTIRADFAGVIQHLRPPKYPYAIDRELARKGRELFYAKAVGCARCHGEYDGEGNCRWTGLHADVGTDRARLEMVNESFVASFRASPITKHGDLAPSRGYAATPLNGVWANYPYLHNGSVPTIWHLLGPASERPRIFSVQAARRLDQQRLGQRLTSTEEAGVEEHELIRRHSRSRDWFYVERPGCGNGGHDYWSIVRTDENRRSLIEYLKTL